MTEQESAIIKALNRELEGMISGGQPREAIPLPTDSPEVDPALITLGKTVNSLTGQFKQANGFIHALSAGDLSVDPPIRNHLISSFKQLHANLQHLTWQTQQIARGDYQQEVSFMGDFSVAFNAMTQSLREKKKMEESLAQYARELETANQTKDKLFSIISHDLKSPFNAILGFSQMLNDQYDDFSEKEKKEFLHYIKDSATSTFAMLEKLLAWSQAQRGEIKARPQPLDLKEMADHPLRLLKNVAGQKNITLTNQISAGSQAFADPDMIKTVLLNLVNNAIKFTRQNGTIVIHHVEKEGLAHISVTDNGIGIPQHKASQLFDVNGANSTEGTANEIGTGLGLIICKEFVQINGGTIDAESQEGVGSTFTFTLPSLLKA